MLKKGERVIMKFNCSRTDLANAVTNVSRAVATKTTMPALEGILLRAKDGQIILSAYDLEIGITTKIEASILSPGEIVVSARLFSEIVRKLPEEVVTIETDERLITYITSGQADYQIVGISSVEFPDLPTFETTDEITIKEGIIKNMIKQTIYAVSDNNSKVIYTGSLFEIKDGCFKIVAVDGFRMAIRSENIDYPRETRFVIPGKTQSEFLKLLGNDDEENVSIIVGERHVMFKVKEYSIVSRLIEGIFLDYNATIPEGEETIVNINTRVMIGAVERMALITSEKIQSPIRFNFTGDEIRLTCSTSVGKAADVIRTTIAGKDVTIGFNHRYLLDALKNADTDEVRLIINGGQRPMIVKPISGDSFLFLVVPMRLS